MFNATLKEKSIDVCGKVWAWASFHPTSLSPESFKKIGRGQFDPSEEKTTK